MTSKKYINIYTYTERPDLKDAAEAVTQRAWAPFMAHHKIIKPRWNDLYEKLGDYQSFICDEDDAVLAVANSVPLAWDGEDASLPNGWDDQFERAMETLDNNLTPTVLAATSAGVDPEVRQRGLGGEILHTMRRVAKRHELDLGLLATVRPNLKSDYPLIPFEDYIQWQRDDGMAFDPWLRLHEKLGARRGPVALKSKSIVGTVEQWQAWTGLSFMQDGDYIVPDTLVPVVVRDDIGSYHEPNIWMHYPALA